jgi:hypothetical protein
MVNIEQGLRMAYQNNFDVRILWIVPSDRCVGVVVIGDFLWEEKILWVVVPFEVCDHACNRFDQFGCWLLV